MELNELLNDPEKIKQFIGLLQSFLDTDTSLTEHAQNPEPADSGAKKIKPQINRKSHKKSTESINKFESMTEFRMHKEDVAIDKKLSKHPPVDRSREFDLVEATCRICGKKESVPPSLVFEGPARYKCNRCSATSG